MTDQRLILHVINSLGISGGAEQQLVANLQRFRDRRLRHVVAHLYSYDFETRHDQLPPGVGVVALRSVGERGGRLTSIRRLSRLIRERNPDLIHCSLAEAALAARLVGPARGVPVIESLVNISHEPVRCIDNPSVSPWKLRVHATLDRLTMGRVRRFHALSRAVADSWQRVVGLPAERIKVIPRGIDVGELDATAARGPSRRDLLRDLGLPEKTFLLISVGRHEAQKGHRYAIEAMPRILARVPHAFLAVVGRPGNRTAALEGLVQSSGLEGRVRFLGRRRDVAGIMAAADLFLFPSLFEGLGVSLLEAMTLRCVCLVSDVVPMSEVVGRGDYGMVFQSRSATALAEAVLQAHGDAGLRARLRGAARGRIEKDFRIEDTSRRIEEMYLRELYSESDEERPAALA